MASTAEKVDLESEAIDILRRAIKLAKTIPGLLADGLAGSLAIALTVVSLKNSVKVQKEKCQLLSDRIVAVMVAVTTELMACDAEALARHENSVYALSSALYDIMILLQELISISRVKRIFKYDNASNELSLVRQQLDTAIDICDITDNMCTEDALDQLVTVIKEREDKLNMLFIHGQSLCSQPESLTDADLSKDVLRPVMAATYLSRSLNSGCFPGTRRTLLDQISAWFEGDSLEVSRVFWLSGLAGTGKSAISHTVCEKLHAVGRLGASFFFSRDEDEPDRQLVAPIIPTLAFQLASVNPTYSRNLFDALQAHPDAYFYTQQKQLKELIMDPLKKVPSLPSYLIILDALDQCDAEGGDLIPLIFRELSASGLNIKVLITSRPEQSIRGMFRISNSQRNHYMTAVLHDMDPSAVKEDITSYLANYLQRIQTSRTMTLPWPGDDVINDLAIRAGMSFTVAASIIDSLTNRYCLDKHCFSHTQLRGLLTSGSSIPWSLYSKVDHEYRQILHASMGNGYNSTPLYARFRKVVGGIILLHNSLSISALAELLEHDKKDLEEALNLLHSLFDIPSNPVQPIRMFHPSFRDFLLTRERCQDPRLYVSKGRAHAWLALCCLNKIMLSDHDESRIIRSTNLHIRFRALRFVPPALSYACQHWGDHLSQAADDPDFQKELEEKMFQFASTKLHYWIDMLNLEGKFILCIDQLAAATKWCAVSS
ncbi:hypothetical protein H0H87_006526 [Tephrocybe sp. NHM501043]|nr:hypothetical protein H0H87_006526 [Tephrocybe sp. NHM501043]